MRLRSGLALIALLVPSSAALAQGTGRVTGVVTDAEAGGPIPNATITVVGTRLTTVTRADGRYSIVRVPAGSHRLRATRLGYSPREDTVSVGADAEITADFALRVTAVPLEAAVVVGYGAVRRADLTGSISSITPNASQVPAQSIEQVLQGKVAGLHVTQASSEPGGGISIRIRGGSSINGNNEPLYVVDGFPIENDIEASSPGNGGRDKTVPFNPLNSLNPADIEAVDVLKDASATAIYGARGANGVIIITTKRGSGTRPVFTLDSYIGTQSVARRYDMLNGADFARFVNEWGAAQATPVVPYTQAQIDSIGVGTDWQDQIFRGSAPIRNLQLGLSGGSGGNNPTRYVVSGGVYDQQGVVDRSAMRRVSLRGGLDQTVGSRLRAGSNLILSRVATTAIPTNGGTNQSAGAIGAALQYYPTIPVRKADGSYTLLAIDGPVALAPSNVPNPVSMVQDVIDRLGDNRVLANLFAEYSLPLGLSLRVSGGADYSARTRDTYYPRTTLQGRDVFGEARRGRNESLNLLSENTLSYQSTFGSFGDMNAVVGYSRQKQNSNSANMLNSNYVSDLTNFEDFGAGARANGPSITTGRADWTFVSYFGRLNYTLRDRYLFTVTGRRDGSSRFGAGKKWGVFPSVGFGWQLSEEPFARNLPLVSNAKLRASWGIAGNPSIRPYQSLTRLSADRYAFNGTPLTGYFPSVLGNEDLTWETSEEVNFGLDLGLLDGRIELVADIYNKTTHDLLLQQQLPLDAGFGTVLVNRGGVRNLGEELGLTLNVLRGGQGNGWRGINWSTSLNYSSNTNRVLNLGGETLVFAARAADDLAINGSVVLVGQPLGVFYGYKVGGILRTAEEAAAYTAVVAPPTGTAWSAGDAWIENTWIDAGPQVINANDRTIIGSPLPDYTIGWSNSFSWSRFDLNTSFEGSYGAELYNLNVNRLESGSPRTNITSDRFVNRWTPENPGAKYPRIGGSLLNIGDTMTSDMLQDGSYTRLRSLTLGYLLDPRWTRRAGFNSARLFVTGTNLVTWTDYEGFNPDVSSISVGNTNRGIDIGSYPLARTWTFGFNLTY